MQPKLLGLIPLHVPNIRWIPTDMDTSSSQSKDESQKPKIILPSLLHLPKTLSISNSRHSSVFRYGRYHNRSPLGHNDTTLSRMHPQDQSSYFSKLPPEVRAIVYGYVMGKETVHLTIGAKKRYAHFVCQDLCAGDGTVPSRVEQGWCRCKVLVGGRAQSARLDDASTNVLRVCWRMYLEAIPHLYNHHTFSLLHITHLLYLPTRTPLCTLVHIRSLRLRWSLRALPYYCRAGSSKKLTLAYPEDTENWERAWDILGSMKGLRDLRVVIVSREGIWEAAWLSLEEKLVESVKKVAGVRRVEVVLPYSSCRVDWNVGGVIFKKPGNGWRIDEG